MGREFGKPNAFVEDERKIVAEDVDASELLTVDF